MFRGNIRGMFDFDVLKISDVWGGYRDPSATDIWFCHLAKGTHELVIASANSVRVMA